MRLSWLSVLLVAAAAPAFAADRHVPGEFPTIQEAVLAAAPGDVVIVAKGRHAGPVVLFGKTGIELRGDGSTIDGAKKIVPIRVEQCRDVRVTGFRLVNSSGDGLLAIDSDDVEVSDCTIVKPAGSGINCTAVAVARLLRNTVSKPGLHGILLGAPDGPTNDAVVEGNVVTRPAGSGVNAFGERNAYRSNRIQRAGEFGIFLTNAADSSQRVNDLAVVEDNEVSKCKDHCIFVGGTQAAVRRNTVKGGSQDAFRILGSGHTIEENVATRPGDDGFFLGAADCDVRRNSATGAKDDGFEVDGDDSTFEDNTSAKSKSDGFDVDGVGNTFRRNTSTTAKGADLSDRNGPGANTYEPSNEFDTSEIG